MIKLLVLDVDGCLTDGSITYTDGEKEIKTFNVKDGLALTSWHKLGGASAIITGRNSIIVAQRAKELGVAHLIQGCKEKGVALQTILQQESLVSEEIAVLGDDLNDIAMLKQTPHSFTPADGSRLLDPWIHHRLTTSGGRGALREMIETILSHDNRLHELVDLWS